MKPKPRKCANWIHTLMEYVEETESPRDFWAWASIFAISSALQRKVWLKFGMDNLYPNLYIMIIAPPGRCRKGAPVGFAKKILMDKGIQVPVFVDSPTKRALTKQLGELAGTSFFQYKNPQGTMEHISQSPLALVSKELSSFLATSPKDMIEVLTDLFDSHDVWEYKTSEKGTDKLYGVCINCLFASTPSWITSNLPEEAIGGGFTSRFVVVPGFEKYKFVPIPKEGDPQLYANLVADLARIRKLAGEFKWNEDAKELYEQWYLTIEQKVRATYDERMHAYLERMHIIAIKVAMSLHVAESDDLVITLKDMKQAIGLAEMVLKLAPKAFGSLGRSETGLLLDEVSKQIKKQKVISLGELMRYNYRNCNRLQLKEVLQTLEDMGNIDCAVSYPEGRESCIITYIPRSQRNYE